VPIVAAAILFDLAVGDSEAFPDEAAGEAACDAAREGEIETGAVGSGRVSWLALALVGTTTVLGAFLGARRTKVLPVAWHYGLIAAVNAFGDVDPDGRLLAAAAATPAPGPGASRG
jgi:L-aminopeptidase/D-esterase-like protein